jgi:4-amino-4-deoxy-L-arabinose transferase-like glycosyltransferase
VVHRKRLLGILAVALILRLTGNLYDMPYRFHPDEHKYVGNAVVMMGRGTLNPEYFENPPFFTYIIVFGLYVLFGAQYAVGAVGNRAEFLAATWPTGTFGLARGLAAVAGTVTCLVLFVVGRRFGGERAGLLAAAFYAVAYLSVRDAHFAVNDVSMTCLVTLVFYFAVRFLEMGRSRDLIFGGLVLGLATATKYNGGIAFVPLLLACAMRPRTEETMAGMSRVVGIGLGWLTVCALGLVGFLVGNPYAVLDSDGFLAGFTAQYEFREQMWRGQSPVPVPVLILQALTLELGWPLALLFPIAAGYCLWNGGPRAKATALALSVIVPLSLYHSFHSLFFARFVLPATPFVALICAWGIVSFLEAGRTGWVNRPLTVGAAFVLLVALPAARSAYLGAILQQPDTRVLAKQYLDLVGPPGSTIVRQSDSTYMVPLSFQRYRVLSLKADPSLLRLTGAPADFYVFSSFAKGRVTGVPEADEKALIEELERRGFARVAFSPLRRGGEPPFELDQVYLPYRHLFRYARPGPVIVVYARPGIRMPPPGAVRALGTRASS